MRQRTLSNNTRIVQDYCKGEYSKGIYYFYGIFVYINGKVRDVWEHDNKIESDYRFEELTKIYKQV